jgi:cell division protein FtsL
MGRQPEYEPATSAPPPPAVEPGGRRYVYNGDAAPSDAAGFAPRGNRPVRKRRRSPLAIIAVLITVSLLIVFYVWNKITVDRLAVEVGDLAAREQKILNANEALRAEINKKSDLDRIGKFAADRLHLKTPKEQPVWFDVDNERLARFQE